MDGYNEGLFTGVFTTLEVLGYEGDEFVTVLRNLLVDVHNWEGVIADTHISEVLNLIEGDLFNEEE